MIRSDKKVNNARDNLLNKPDAKTEIYKHILYLYRYL